PDPFTIARDCFRIGSQLPNSRGAQNNNEGQSKTVPK
ncbi:hypothetical protein scyTo_0018233, partial [Scyliorhinus torazame]|nr:hypothetical protein [Scyliorhinus torazame]